MLSVVHAVWPLLLGYFFVMLGQGLHSTLIGIRAGFEDFDPTIIGIVIAFYTMGLMLGTFFAGRLIQRIGHIRAYAVASALISTAMLMYILLIHPVFWSFTRFIIGIAMAIIFSATESWLNDSAENHNRGAYLSAYMIVTNLGMGFGQFLLLAASPEGMRLFVLLSVLLSLSVVPVLLTVRNVPSFEISKPISLTELYKVTPFGVINMLLIGTLYSALFIMAGVYTSEEGFSLVETSIFISVLVFTPALSQSPIGRLSDRFDRRLVIVPLLLISIGIIVGILLLPLNMPGRIVAIGLLAACVIPIHGLIIAHTNDFMSKEQMVGASNSMIRLFALGSVISPPIVGLTMQMVGPAGYFYFLLVTACVMVSYSVYRIRTRWGVLQDERSPYVGMPTSSGIQVATTLNPEAETLAQGYTVADDDSAP